METVKADKEIYGISEKKNSILLLTKDSLYKAQSKKYMNQDKKGNFQPPYPKCRNTTPLYCQQYLGF